MSYPELLSGAEVRSLMRRHRKTILGLAESMNITLKRVRQVRDEGVKGKYFVQDWMEAIQASEVAAAGAPVPALS